MKQAIGIIALLSGLVFAQTWSLSAAETPTTNSPASDPAAAYAGIYKQELDTMAKARVLRELGDEHTRRAEEANKGNQPDKFKWETELANELKTRAAEASAQADALTRQRIGAEEKEKPGPAVLLLSADETAYLSRLDSAVWAIEQEVQAALQNSRSFSAQLLTNNTPDDLERISFLAQDNDRAIKFLERDRTLLELQKLQYRAIRKR